MVSGVLQKAIEEAAGMMAPEELTTLVHQICGEEIIPVGFRVGGYEFDGLSFHAKPATTLEEIGHEQKMSNAGRETEASKAANAVMRFEISSRQGKE